MDQILAKISNIGYEIFGVFLPGFVFFLFLVWTWWCAGAAVPLLTSGYMAPFGVEGVSGGVQLMPLEFRWGVVVYLAVASYFLGHLILWVGRGGKAIESDDRSRLKRDISRVRDCLMFSVPKPLRSYDEALSDYLSVGCVFLKIPVERHEWRAFYPVAKSRLSHELTQSLVSTYQNKYTLHRSLAVAAAIWFWMNYFQLIFATTLSIGNSALQVRYAPSLLSTFLSLLTVWGFSDSYLYNWKMFGNTILTETFMLSKKG
jgi:hypothetical protein